MVAFGYRIYRPQTNLECHWVKVVVNASTNASFTPFMLSPGSGPLLKRSKLDRPKSVHTAAFLPFATTQGACETGAVAKVTYCPTSYKYCFWF